MIPIGLCAQLACIWEATARKPGNVHRFADFEDTSYLDFLASAAAIAPVLETAGDRRLGATILEAVQATRRVTGSNTNLGIVLLLAPLAAVSVAEDLRQEVCRILAGLDVADARLVYQAIRLAAPSGLGKVDQQDLAAEPTLPLKEVMTLAADRDLIARQYCDGFQTVFDDCLPALKRMLQTTSSLEAAIIGCHLHLMALHPDSLVARKCGRAEAEEAARGARQVLDMGWPCDVGSQERLAELDRWLRTEGHRRNPGTTADLVTASLFVALRDGTIQLPSQYPWALV
jgi:triphosphoribosyl-dephospho-CoA synthase